MESPENRRSGLLPVFSAGPFVFLLRRPEMLDNRAFDSEAPTSRIAMHRLALATLAVTLIALGVSGCSKCSDWIYWGRGSACQTTQPQQN